MTGSNDSTNSSNNHHHNNNHNNNSNNAYDMTDISIAHEDAIEIEDQRSILSGVPSQTSRKSRGSLSLSSNMSEKDWELNSFPLAMTSKIFFLIGCAMYLWLSIDDMSWAHEARTIPASVLEADDDMTWRSFRLSQQQQQENSGGDGGTRHRHLLPGSLLSLSKTSNPSGRLSLAKVPLTESAISANKSTRKLIDDETFSIPWDDLPFTTQIAAATLGHDEATWNSNGAVFTDLIPWNELDVEQQDAAVTLGYNEYLWNMLRGFVDPVSTTTTTNAVNPAASSGTPQNWGSYFWIDLPDDIRAQAIVLGYEENSWNNGERIDVDDLFWAELSTEQQQAASALGYSQDTWDVYATATNREPDSSTTANTGPSAGSTSDATAANNAVTTPSATATSSTNTDNTNENSSSSMPVAPNGDWRTYPWDELPPEIQGGATALGFTQELWDGEAVLNADIYFWDELSSAQQQAAEAIFGYNRVTWNASGRKWQTVDWNDLPEEIRTDAIVLGYDERLWSIKADIDTESYDWEQLSGAQQQAAFTIFGYTEDTWAGTSGTANTESDSVSKAVSENQEIKNGGGGRAGGRGGADDDYVFSVERKENDVWVSKYQIVYFVASICFVVVGILGKKSRKYS